MPADPAPSRTERGCRAEPEGRHAAPKQIRLSSSLRSRLILKDKLGRLQGTPALVNINSANARARTSDWQEPAKSLQSPIQIPTDKELGARHCQPPPHEMTCLPCWHPCCHSTQPTFCLRHQSTAGEPRSDQLPASAPALQTLPLRDRPTQWQNSPEQFKSITQAQNSTSNSPPKIAPQIPLRCLGSSGSSPGSQPHQQGLPQDFTLGWGGQPCGCPTAACTQKSCHVECPESTLGFTDCWRIQVSTKFCCPSLLRAGPLCNVSVPRASSRVHWPKSCGKI